MNVVRGLVVRQPWLDLLLSGTKTWEMRSKSTSVRGPIALIEKGSGMVLGTAEIVDCLPALDPLTYGAHFGKHGIGPSRQPAAVDGGWLVPWVMAGAQRLDQPVPYDHPNGAVIWVKLEPAVSAAIACQAEDPVSVPTHKAGLAADATDVAPQARQANHLAAGPEDEFPESPAQGPRPLDGSRVPVAADGTWFGPHLSRGGTFTVGAKASEQKIFGFAAALHALERMPTPRWRRPNAAGNWGIVSGVRWVLLEELGPAGG
jgi:hypothetical protein